MSRELSLAAVDLGASSGRVMTARVGPGRLNLQEVHRFPNRPVRTSGTLHWDVLALHAGVLDGLRAAGREAGHIDGIGIDSWAVDVGLLDDDGALLGNPVHYRDARHAAGVPAVHAVVPPEQLYRVNGLQHLPFNTIFQLAAARGTAQFAAARTVLLVPDLLTHWLTGAVGAEVTNASTTGLLNATTGAWCTELVDRLDLPRSLFPPLRQPGEQLGELLPDVLLETGLAGPVPVTAVGSHDTASAVVGVPAEEERFAYISCGTWSLVGLELAGPVLTEASRRAGFTNELGVDGTVRYLRNVMGLWLLQESLRTWACRPTWPGCSPRRGRCTAFPLSSTPTTRASSPLATCRPGLREPAPIPVRLRRRARPRPCAASSTASRWPSGAPCGGQRSCPDGTSTSFT